MWGGGGKGRVPCEAFGHILFVWPLRSGAQNGIPNPRQKRRQCHLYSKEHTCSPSLPGRGASSVEKNMFIFIPFLFVLNKVDEEPFFIIVRRRFFRKALNFDGKERHCGAKMDAFVCIPSQAAFAARVRALTARNV